MENNYFLKTAILEDMPRDQDKQLYLMGNGARSTTDQDQENTFLSSTSTAAYSQICTFED